jgi:hypothetical protein
VFIARAFFELVGALMSFFFVVFVLVYLTALLTPPCEQVVINPSKCDPGAYCLPGRMENGQQDI